MTDQKRSDIYEQLLISEDKCVINREDLKRLRNGWVKDPASAPLVSQKTIDFLNRIDALIERRQVRTND